MTIGEHELNAELGQPFRDLWRFAYGHTERVPISDGDAEDIDIDYLEDDEEGPYAIRRVPGKLRPGLPSLEREIRDIREPLAEFLSSVRKTQNDVVVIFDGLDRLLDATKFWSVVHQDLRLLRELKVSVMATAPLSVLFGAGVGQSISDHFDRVHHLSVIPSESRNRISRSVLEKRRASESLEPGGGVLHLPITRGESCAT